MADEQPDSFTNFIQVNGTWVLTFTGLISACVGTTFVYFLKSRCTKVSIGCINCERDPISEDNLETVTIENNNI